MLLSSALLAIAGPAAAAPQEAFQDWLRDAAEAEELRVLRWGPVDRDDDGRADYLMATMCDTRADTKGFAPWRVYEAEGRRWVVEQHGMRCSPSGSPAFEPLEPDAIERYCGAYFYCSVFIEPIDGQIAVTRTDHRELKGFFQHHTVEDWVRGTTHKSWTEFTEGDGGSQIRRNHEAAFIVVGRDLTERPTFNRVLSGARAYDGPQDASLSVVAVEPSYDHVHVVLRVTDDVHTARDRLELWWVCRSCTPPSSPGMGARDAIRHIRLKWSDGGGPVTVLPPGDDPDTALPVAWRAADGAITVRFTHGQFTQERPHHLRGPNTWELPFTAVFHDVDGPTATATRIATSDWDRAEPLTYGALLRFRDHRRFPALGGDFVVRRLAPGDRLRTEE